MDLKKAYETLGGSYEAAITLFRSEKIAIRFLYKFLDDPSFSSLKTALSNRDYETALINAHTLSGLAMNLNFKILASSARTLSEYLKQNDLDSAIASFPQVEEDYNIAVDTIQMIPR